MTEYTEQIIAYTDGGSRGNPGPAAAAFSLSNNDGKTLLAKAFFLQQTTNNVAEYTAVIKALQHLKQFNPNQITIFCDSELLVKQLNGQYKVKSEQLRPLFRQAVHLLKQFKSSKIIHIPREKNKQADKLVNQALNLQQDIEIVRPAV